MKTFTDYDEARKYAKSHELPLWDTHAIPHRYFVGHLTAEMEDDPENADWEELSVT